MQKKDYPVISWLTIAFAIILSLTFIVIPAVATVLMADFTAVPRSGVAPLDVQFMDLSTNMPNNWEWSFGDNPGCVYTTNILEPTAIDVVYPNGTVDVLYSGTGLSYGLALDPEGNIYSSDFNAGSVRKFRPDGGIEMIGSGFTNPAGIARDHDGTMYVADSGISGSVYKIAPGGAQTPVGSGFTSPGGVAVDHQGNVYVSDTIGVYRITPGGVQTPVGAGYSSPMGVAVDLDGNVYVADMNSVIKVTSGGAISTIASGGQPMGIAVDDFTGDVYYGDVEVGIIYKITPGGIRTVVATANTLGGAVALKPESFAREPSHTYTTPGMYTVSLIASNSGGSDAEVKAGYITVTAFPTPVTPVAAFTNATPRNGISPLTVSFTDQSTNTPTSWFWNFGDGDSTNATQQNPVHTYTTPGTYYGNAHGSECCRQ